ncbi:MAG: FKBP-type peptidyl-prolyl cis-trans isomerase [Bacteroidota bacterium]|jgi:FKBP-type peptidyl-prolyl cis-trans isomerase FkpA
MKKISLLATSLLLFNACSNDGSQFDGYKRAENGLHYKFFKQDEAGTKAQIGYGVIFKIELKNNRNDSTVFSSKQQSQDGTGEIQYLIQKSSFKGSLEDGMMMMAKGDSASFIISADSFFLKTQNMQALPQGIKQGDFLKATIVMKDVLSSKQVEEKQAKMKAEYEEKMRLAQEGEQANRDKYLADNKITAKPSESGLIFIETKKGNGNHPKATDMVKVHYTGTLLDGTKFDSSLERGEPANFPLNQVIAGWTEGIQLMSKGSKAKLVIPSSIGYGPQGNGPIPPFSTLVFEVELLDFSAAPAMPEGHSAGDGHNH